MAGGPRTAKTELPPYQAFVTKLNLIIVIPIDYESLVTHYVFRGYRKATPGWNGLNAGLGKNISFTSLLRHVPFYLFQAMANQVEQFFNDHRL